MTLGEIAARIENMIARPDLGTEIRQEIRLACKRYERELWYLNEVRGAVLQCAPSVVWYDVVDLTSANGYTAATNVSTQRILTIDYMRRIQTVTGLDEPMTEIEYSRFERLQEGSNTDGAPTYFTRYAGQLGIWPAPPSAEQMYFSGKFKPTVPSADIEASVWFAEAQELIEAAATAAVHGNFTKDFEEEARCRQREIVQIAALRGEGARKGATGRLRAHM